MLAAIGAAAWPQLMVSANSVSSAFTYQGQLKFGGIPAEGDHDFRFQLYDAPNGGSPVGGNAVHVTSPVVNGLFAVELEFGLNAFNGEARWLEVGVRATGAGGDHNILLPRQSLTAAPYALYALDAPSGTGGYWTLSGDDLYNNNTGRVGVRTGSPKFNLHVYDMLPTGPNQPPTTFGVQWTQSVIPPPPPPNEWFYFAVGGSAPTVGSGTRLIRESGTELHFQTQDAIYSGSPSTQMVLDADGRVGIGTMSPAAMLDVDTTSGVHGIRSSTPAIPISAYRTSTSGTSPAIHAECNSEDANASAIRGYIMSTSPGSGSAAVSGHNYGTQLKGYGVKGSHDGYGVGVYGLSTNGIAIYGKTTNGGYAGWFDGGPVKVGVLEITGADVAEKFPVSHDATEAQPGMVMEIDPENPGELCLARGAYNRRVAGVISGANNLPTGAILGHLPGNEDALPVALSGRVWVRCDATAHAVEPGDLLTTSSVPGHAMKVTDHDRANGAILGKAMTGLEAGEKGLVLVLVALQ
jgi:hypothetical protein